MKYRKEKCRKKDIKGKGGGGKKYARGSTYMRKRIKHIRMYSSKNSMFCVCMYIIHVCVYLSLSVCLCVYD